MPLLTDEGCQTLTYPNRSLEPIIKILLNIPAIAVIFVMYSVSNFSVTLIKVVNHKFAKYPHICFIA